MARTKGAKNKPKTQHIQYELPIEESKQEIAEMQTIEVKEPVAIATQVVVNTPEAELPSISDMLAAQETVAAPVKIITELTPLQKKRIEDERMVKGTFVYRAKPGGRYMTVLRKYKRDPNAKNAQGFLKIDMTDGKTYSVPYWVAEWLNGEHPDLSCCDWKHNADNINLIDEARRPPERVPVFRFIIQEYAA